MDQTDRKGHRHEKMHSVTSSEGVSVLCDRTGLNRNVKHKKCKSNNMGFSVSKLKADSGPNH